MHADLQAKGVRCWFAPHDMHSGRKIHEQIDEAIRLHDRLLLILQKKAVPIQSRCPDIPAELANVIHRSLAKEPGERFADVRAMRQALLPCAPGPG